MMKCELEIMEDVKKCNYGTAEHEFMRDKFTFNLHGKYDNMR